MRIAQIAPLHARVPLKLYGGTERVVSFLTEELVREGHDVTLFGSGDSQTSARLVGCCDMALRVNPTVRDTLPYHMIMLDEVRRRANEFDILHPPIDASNSSAKSAKATGQASSAAPPLLFPIDWPEPSD
jgi:hypothetical protein